MVLWPSGKVIPSACASRWMWLCMSVGRSLSVRPSQGGRQGAG